MPVTDQNRYLIVVADQAMAKFYSRAKRNSALESLCTLRNDSAQKKTAELISDRGGRSFDSFGRGRHTMSNEEVDPRAHDANVFANQIRDRVIKAKRRGEFAELVIIAAPRFLGVLRKSFAASGGITPDRTIDKDVVAQDTSVIRKLLEY